VASLLSYLIEAAYPNASRDGTAACEPYRTLHLIGLIRTVIDYGKQLIITARQRAGTAEFLAFAAPFGTASLKLLVARIGCAITRAVLLEQKLQYQAGLGGSYRPEPARAAAAHRAPRAAAGARTARTRRTVQTGPARDPELAHLPTVAQITAEIRRLPLQQVIATICRDLGITREHELWQQLNQALSSFGVSLPVPEPEKSQARSRAGAEGQSAEALQADASATPAQPSPPMARPPAQAPLCTGPPVSAEHPSAA
jgi:hypothetical protein